MFGDYTVIYSSSYNVQERIWMNQVTAHLRAFMNIQNNRQFEFFRFEILKLKT